jgi:tRNA pseudouridine38-40 synthase
VLRVAIETVVREPVPLVGAGRTDAGVHGWGQVVSGELPATIDLDDLARRVNRMCAPDIVVRDAAWAADDFHARFSASWRRYRYHVWNAPQPNPFLQDTAWHIVAPLQVWAMQLACDPLIGEHDFTTFCRKPRVAAGKREPTMVRRVLTARWHEVESEWGPGLLRFEITATSFCHQMVRSIVGTLVEVGAGRLHAGDVRGILLAGDRAAAAQVAPPQGLVLWQVGYPEPGSPAV